jgi:membrane-bound lytic murein transglycosylase D
MLPTTELFDTSWISRRCHSVSRLSITLFAGGIAVVAGMPPASAERIATAETLMVPELGNTVQADRLLAREVTDEHVVDPSLSSPAQPTAAASAGRFPPAATVTGNDIWNRIRRANQLPVNDNERVAYYRRQYAREAIWVSKILRRSEPFLAYLVNALDARYLPIELALLPAIESGFKSNVHSAGDAAGIWQIVPATARDMGIQQTAWFDGRADIVASTTAAIDYFSYLNATFHGDWELTLAAYNAGLGRVQTAMRRNREADKPTTFEALALPTETRNYVPKLMALVQLIKDGQFDLFDMPVIPVEPAFVTIDAGFRISLDNAARMAGISTRELRRLNAGLIHSVTAPGGPHTLHVPVAAAARFTSSLANADKTRLFSPPATHEVAAGDTISSIALRYGIRQQYVRDLNQLDNSRIFIGQKLAIIDSHTSSDSIEYVVSIGDTLSQIARRFAVDLSDITDAEGEPPASDTIHPGQMLRIAIRLADTG